MSTSYYFVPKDEDIEKLYQIKLTDINGLLQVYSQLLLEITSHNIHCYNTDDITTIYTHKIHTLKTELSDIQNLDITGKRLLSYLDIDKIHICNTAMGWRPLLQANEYFSNMNELKLFSVNYNCINEYGELIDFTDLIDKLQHLNTPSNTSHSNLGFYVYTDKCGYEFTTVDFS